MADTKPDRATPALPAVGGDLVGHSQILKLIKECIEVRERRTGSKLDSFAKLRELVELEILKIEGERIILGAAFDDAEPADDDASSGGGGGSSGTDVDSILTANGDLLTKIAGVLARLVIGSSGQVLTVSGGLPSWQTPSTGVTAHGDLTGLANDDHTQYVLRSILSANGDLFVRLSGAISRLGVGSNGQVLAVASSLPAWTDLSSLTLGPYSDLRRRISTAQSTGSTNDFTGSSGWSSGTIGAINLAATGTQSAPTQGTTSLLDQMVRNRYTSSASTNSSAGLQEGSSITNMGVYRKITATALGGGFDIFMRLALNTVRSDQRIFFGLYSSTSAPSASGDPSALVNMIGVGKDQADTNLKLMSNDGSGTATKTDLGISATSVAGKVLELTLHCDPNGSSITYSLNVVDDANVISGTINSDLIAADTRVWPLMYVNTGSATSTAVTIDFARLVKASNT